MSETAAGQPRVDFYVIRDPSPTARLRLACRLAEKAYLAEQKVLVWHGDPEELRSFDDLLWTFADRSFVPHAFVGTAAADDETPVLLSHGDLPSQPLDIVINLDATVPACASRAQRVIEIVDGDAARRQAGRARFKTYREMGLQPASHDIAD